MAGDAFKRRKPGDPLQIPAGGWNAMMELVLAHRRQARGVGMEASGLARQADVVSVKNNSGAAQTQFAVLALGNPAITAAANERSFLESPVLLGTIPAANEAGKFCILLQPLAEGAVGPAVVSGICPVQITMIDVNHECADIDPGETGQLRSTNRGTARILWDEGGIAPYTKWAIVLLGAPVQENSMWCKVIDGRDEGKTYAYLPESGPPWYGRAWYVDEVDPWTKEAFYPSRTRDAANNYIETTVHNNYPLAHGFGAFWPIPFWTPLYARWSTLMIMGNSFPSWVVFAPPMPCEVEITSVSAAGRMTEAVWLDGDGSSLSLDVHHIWNDPAYTTPPPNAVWYPFAQVGDRICVHPIIYPGGTIHDIAWRDATPRIMLRDEAKVGASTERDVRVDRSAGSGKPWILDTNT